MLIVVLKLNGSEKGFAPSKEQIQKVLAPWFALFGWKMSDSMSAEFADGDAFTLVRLDGPESSNDFSDLISDFYRYVKGSVKDSDLAARFSGGIEVVASEDSRGYHRSFLAVCPVKASTNKKSPKKNH